jgi:hypothetical protein
MMVQLSDFTGKLNNSNRFNGLKWVFTFPLTPVTLAASTNRARRKPGTKQENTI